MKLQPGDCEVCGSEERILLAVSRVFIECPSCRSDHEAGQWKHCVGDIAYVKETWARSCLECEHGDDGSCFEVRYDGCDIIYKADGIDGNYYDWRNPWKPSIHMPRAAARTFLRITGVKAQRPQELTILEIGQEGVRAQKDCDIQKNTMECAECGFCAGEMREEWRKLWDSVQQKKDLTLYGYNANPWCFVYEFEVVPYESESGGESS